MLEPAGLEGGGKPQVVASPCVGAGDNSLETVQTPHRVLVLLRHSHCSLHRSPVATQVAESEDHRDREKVEGGGGDGEHCVEKKAVL